ncbi:MAG: ImmA/IrrE family metallo-endopeptidase [Ruminococcaceae bacterium]|nr:ImmA/IrrE family metallo-endopeptidase [Oscillospiraceae bacterium]
MRIEHKLALDYIREYSMGDVTASSVVKALEKQGYTVVEYSRISNQPDVETLLTSIGLKDFSRTVRAFYYHDNNIRVVFVEENLSDSERLVLLAHEQGHILCDPYHKGKDRSDIMCERSAAEFAHYLTVGSVSSKMSKFAIRNKKLLLAAAAVLAVAAVGSAVALGISGNGDTAVSAADPERVTTAQTDSINEPNIYLADDAQYFVTIHGKKYHRENCSYIKGKVVTGLTLEQCEDSGYEPCSYCIEEG